MASTGDLAPTRSSRKTNGAMSENKREEHLEEMVTRLQDDLKSIASTLAKMGGDKVADATGSAKSEANKVMAQGQHLVEDLQGQASELERQLKGAIRERPLTAVAGAVGFGFILALLARR